MDRIITVEGEGTYEAAPDSVRFECLLSGRRDTQKEAVEAAADSAVPLRKALMDAGFQADALKTVSVSARPYYENVRDGDAVNTVFAGFEYDHRLRFDADCDNATVGKVMDAMVSADVQFSMSYRLSDTSDAMRLARDDAVRDATLKAEQLAKAADVRLGKIMSITYGQSEGAPAFRTMSLRSGAPDMVPENITFSDRVTVCWSLL